MNQPGKNDFNPPKNAAVCAINEKNRQFWEVQSQLAAERISNRAIFQTAKWDLESEVFRQVPIYCRKTLEKALEDAQKAQKGFDEEAARRFLVEFSRKGGKAPKSDKLQKFIVSAVRHRPFLTISALQQLLNESHDFEVSEEDIAFTKDDGVEKLVPITALKDRLYRAKKNFRSR